MTTPQDVGSELLDRIRSLPPKKQRALIALLRRQGVDLSALDAVRPLARSADEPPQLSFTQQRLWFLDRLDGGSAAYNIPLAVRLSGPLDRSALRRALAAVVERHEVLRTRFEERDGVPYQRIGDGRDFVVGDGEAADPADLARICEQEAAAPFDLERGPLVRARLLRESEQEHVLLVTMHHAVSDGWSVGVLVRDLTALYEAFRSGRPSPLAPLPVQYADYAHWQRQWLGNEVQARQVEYWKGRLAGVDPRLTLPPDRERPAVKTYAGASETFRCPPELLGRLREIAGAQDATLYMLLLAAYMVVLHRWTRQTDIAVGTVVANRSRIEVEELIGFFANTLVMRADLDGDPTFRELLAQVKQTALEAYDHQDVPFEAVVDALQLERSLAHSPVFQTLLVLQGALTGREGALGELAVSPVDVPLTRTKFDLTLDLQETPDGLAGTVEYNTDLYDRETVLRFTDHYGRLLAAIAADPDQPVAALDMVGEPERRRVLETWNDTRRPYSDDTCLHRLFEARVARHPGRTALVDAERSWTYAELNTWANRIADALRRQGIGPDDLVGLCVERSAEMVAAIYGILKAGGAYMPIDPAYPATRIGELIEGSGAAVALTQPHLDAGPLAGAAVLVLHRDGRIDGPDGAPAADLAEADPVVAVGAGNLAYVIHTSGSTGRPKGVMIEHRAAVNRIEWMQNEYRLTETDVVLQKTPFSFDVSVWEFFWPLLTGARLAVAEAGGHTDPGYLVDAVERFGVTTLHFVPSMLRAVVEEPGWSRCTSVRQVFCSGEALPPDLVARHYGSHRAPLVNLYGPTEAAVDVTHWTCPADPLPRVVPIGRPIQNIRMYVLDGALRPQGIGCVGDLYIAGDGLARGYLNQPELTRERFVDDPFVPGTRMYRTGDLARWLPDGTLEYLGRSDDQVKLRGLRIELGEIEHRLAGHPRVRSCAVVLREDQPGEPRLVAYTVLEKEQEQGTEDAAVLRGELVRHLERTLPEYMVPSAFVVLEALPVTTHGKLDRRALPAPGIEAFAQGAYVAPATPTERLLASLWADLLGFDSARIGAEDHFFALGGHSLMITVLVARLREAGLHASVQDVFRATTLSDLAARIDGAGDGARYEVPANRIPAGCERITPDMLPLAALDQEQIDTITASVPGGAPNIQDIYPLVSAQEGILFHHLMDPEHDPYLVCTLYAADDEAAAVRFVDALQAVVDRHDAMRTAVLTAGLPEPVQVVHRTAPLPVERVLLAPDRDAEEQIRALLVAPRPMAVDRAPLLRLVVAEDPHSERRFLLLNVHHLIEDATSLRLTLEELGLHLTGRTDLLQPPAPYREFVAHTLHNQATDEVEAYFRAALGDVTEPTTPFGLADVHGDGRGVERLRRALPDDLTREVRAQAQRLRLSPAVLFHAAWACVVAAGSGRDDVVFGAIMSGRMQGVPGVERMLGNFINTLPMRVGLAGRSVRTLIDDVDRVLKELVALEQSPLSVAQRCSGLEGDAPLFSAVVNFRHFEPSSGEEAATTRIDDGGVHFVAASDGINYPVAVSADDFGSELSLDIQVDESLGCEAVAGYVETALAGIVAALAADDGLATEALAVEVLPARERRRLLTEWNDTAAEVAGESLVEAFEAQVRRTPDATALIFEGDTLSYAELNARANRLAHWLIERGAGPDRLVAVRMPRSFDLVTAVYGVVKSGAGYLPMEPDLPADRVEQMLEDAAPLLVLEELPDTSGQPATDPVSGVTADHTGYVIYTSGSTGRPNGLVIPHRAGLNWIAWNQHRFPMAPRHRMLLKTSVSFDVSVPELFWPLQVGASLVIARPDGHRDPAYLVRLIREQGVTDVDFVPSMLAAFLAEPQAAECTSLRRVEAAGEALPVELAERFTRVLPGAELYNGYGPTEAGPATAWRYRTEPGATSVPIGTVAWNTRAYVLDGAMRLAPQGVPGELYLNSVQLARGYLNRPDLTAERFVDDPFAPSPGERMYRTGDLVRWRADGVMEYLGRADDQVKVRGFRVEPGEIADALLAHPAVHRAVVVPYESGQGVALAAYVSPTAEWVAESSPAATADHLDRWRSVLDERHAAGGTDRPCGNLAALMEEHRPKRVLQVGGADGLLLRRYAQACAAVEVLDLSEEALDRLREEAAEHGWSHVTPLRGEALAAAELTTGTFDAIVLDGVVRTFPDRHYLEQALAVLVPLLADGGRILVGDVGDLDLHAARTVARELRRATGPVTAGELALRVRSALRHEEELLISPSWFAGLSERLPELAGFDVLLGGPTGAGESAHGYDVVLAKGPAGAPEPHPWLEAATPERLRELLDAGTPDRFGVSGLTDPRLTGDVLLAEGLTRGDPAREVTPPADGAQPPACESPEARALEDVLRHAEELGYRVALTRAQDRPDGLDVLISRGAPLPVRARAPYRAAHQANAPLTGRIGPALARLLKDHLAARLPHYMVPGVFVVLEDLPVTANGKVDKRALPLPDEEDLAKEAYVAPRTEIERTLCRIVGEVLGVTEVGLRDSFFDLGGHSLLATRLTLRVMQELHRELPLQLVFTGATVEAMAEALEQAPAAQEAPPLDHPADRSGEDGYGPGEAPLALAQADLWFLARPGHLAAAHDNVQLAFRIEGALDRDAYRRAVQALVDRHAVLRTGYPRRDGEVVQRVHEGVEAAVDVVGMGDEEQTAAWLRAERARPFDPEGELMVRAHLLAHSADEHTAVLTRPWGVFDGWSVNLVLAELLVLYRAMSRGEEPEPGPAATGYADFARRQRHTVGPAELERQRAYWRERLAGLPVRPSLPTDYRRPPVKTYQGSSVGLRVPAELLAELRRLSREQGATLYLTLLSAFAVLLGGWSDARETTVGTAVANRPEAELEQVVGYFTNTLVLRLDVAPERAFTEVLTLARTVTAEAHEHKDLPFQDLVRTLVPEPDPAWSPLFQVMFNLLPAPQDAAGGAREPGDLAVVPLPSDPGTAHFDLNLVVREEPDGLRGYLEYSTDLFGRPTAERMARAYERLLGALAADPEADVLTLRSAAETSEVHDVRNSSSRKPS
ncbi:amino acid adenylation domain-containing protein [Kitasatospora sp. NPDC101157]|uniref:amino acid adenylation domain-containing protein n=1 Tax=Kitasatospora sp. NPDC101157 TaxID=3364098 RepID=UPI00381518B6